MKRLLHPAVGAAAALALAAVLQVGTGVLYEAPAYKVYFPIAITGIAAAWLAVYRPGSQEERLFRAELVGIAVGAVSAFRFLLGEPYEGLAALKLGLVLGLCALLGAAIAMYLPPPEPLAALEPKAKRKLRRSLGAVALLLVIGWYVPALPWRWLWKSKIQDAAVTYLEGKYRFDDYILTVNGVQVKAKFAGPYARTVEEPSGESVRYVGDYGPATYELENMIWSDAVTVHVQASINGPQLCGQGIRIVLQLTPSGWIVVDDVCEWIT